MTQIDMKNLPPEARQPWEMLRVAAGIMNKAGYGCIDLLNVADAQLPSGKPRHGARRYNRMAARGNVFMPGKARREPRA